ncbi:MAG TPA: VOC family protein [Chloroflexota bacterium]|nr:VOC family protein [Chloroflexota bacterium]
MAEVEGLTHTGPVALSLMESEEFYGRALGARLVNRNHFDTDNAPRGRSLHTVMTVADYMFTPMLPFDVIPSPPADLQRGINNFRSAFAVSRSRFAEVIEHLRRNGIPFEGPVVHPPDGPLGESIYFQDPGGNFQEICWRRDELEQYRPVRLPARATVFRPEPPVEGLVPLDLLAGAVVEVRDLAATRAFYARIFGDGEGEWEAAADRLAYHHGLQSVYFVACTEPRTLPGSGHHVAYRVGPDRLPALVAELEQGGHRVSWWREDHPAEKQATAYVVDPSGNQVQLVSGEPGGVLLDHGAIEVFDMDPMEFFYTRILGGTVDHCFGRAVEDILEAKRAADGDPCAPWTRLTEKRYTERKGGKPGPNQQLFVRYGSTMLDMVLAKEHRQEPPEDQAEGTPRLIFQARVAAGDAVTALVGIGLACTREGDDVYVRDPAGNFLQLVCRANAR